MILSSIYSHRRKIAFLLFMLFYFNTISPLMALGNVPVEYYNYDPGYGTGSNDNPFTVSRKNHYPVLNGPVKMDPPAIVFNNPVITTETHFSGNQQSFIDGPGQPEMQSFKSVNSNNMVDLFTGDFTYNIPLLDVGGYPVSIHYSSGVTMDQEASWVGLGWNINPGSINRNMRGLPDDFDGLNDSLTKTQNIKENRTTGVTVDPSIEIVGVPFNLSASLGIFHNTYRGFGLETGVGIGGTARTAFGALTGNLSISNNSQEGLNINPSLTALFGREAAEGNAHSSLGVSTGYSSRAGISSLQIQGGIYHSQLLNAMSKVIPGVNCPSVTLSFATIPYTPSITMPVRNTSYSFTGKLGDVFWATNIGGSFKGYVNIQDIAPEDRIQKIPAAGYLYSTNANGRENVVLDFNRQDDKEFNYKSTPHIAIPQYTYDAFSISGEGIGGSFRPYRGDVGYIFDHAINTRSNSLNGSFDAGAGGLLHGGLEITHVATSNANHRWTVNNGIASKLNFQTADTTYEPVYFRNPGEKTTNAKSYYRAIGDDSLIRIKLSGKKDNARAESAFVKYDKEGRIVSDLAVNDTLVKKQRDKRTQSISYFTAADAAILGLDKVIKSYKENTIPIGTCVDTIVEIQRVDNVIRKKNHLSEISVLNSDGRKYVYGLPIYNVAQKDVSFSVNKEKTASNLNKGLTNYQIGVNNSTSNPGGKDGYFSSEEMPAYAHNFLLTGIVSPDYVDITGNGISEDDPGDAVKFNYTQVFGKTQAQGYYQWRLPYERGKANYNEGFKTYDRDDKATYLYGKKEMWYLNSIESKTMIAVFRILGDRQDAWSATDENGGLEESQKARRLVRIDLYVKADLVKNGANNAKPVKSVHFDYSYDLCKGNQGNGSVGKLTLTKISFTYNKNDKKKQNPYIFSYNGINPDYNARYSDRWGSYKHPGSNPDGLNNADFPYSTQNKDTATRNAAAWNLTDIKLPSGGKMVITYEADDYAFVQDKRATRMFTIAGINTPGNNKLYNRSQPENDDYDKIYINTTDELNSKADIKNRYLAIDDVLYFKFAVNMPNDKFGSGVEMVPGYATIADYDTVPGNHHQFWIKVAPVDGRSPFLRAALQFLRLNLPAKAYPGYEGYDKLTFANLLKMMATSFPEMLNTIKGFDGAAKFKRWCNIVNLDSSFVRLSSPIYKKYGGGHRVKKIEVYDNWKKMTNQKESVYGQQYSYTTTENVDGQELEISSGVATYEPVIGAEENPFRRPINYVEQTAPMAPVNFMFSEEPVGETFFSAPMVGYSKVRIRTINAKAKSANGWDESEFFTSRDYPTIVQHTLLEPGVSKIKYETVSHFLRFNHMHHVTLSQGFLIELNDMNGKMKAQSTYAETDSLNPTTYSLNFYKSDNDREVNKHLNNNVWVVDSVNGHIDTAGQVGKDIEIMTDLREQQSLAVTKGYSPNLDLISPFAPPFLPVLPLVAKLILPQKEDTRFRSAAVVKIIQRYGILDSVVVMDKGSVVSTKNLLYDAETGNVLLSRTNNEFNDPIYNFNYPAYWAYSGMDLAYKNINAVFQAKGVTGGYQLSKGILYKEGGGEPFPVNRFFESGDEVYVSSAVKATVGEDCTGFTPLIGQTWKGKLWVIEAAKGLKHLVGTATDSSLYFIDSLGRVAPNMVIKKMVIVRSGKRNMPDVSAGNVVMLANPLRKIGDDYRVVIDNTTKVVNAAASTFKDLWKVENTMYEEDSCYTTTETKTSPNIVASVRLEKKYFKSDGDDLSYTFETDPAYMATAHDYVDNHQNFSSRRYFAQSVLNFDMQNIPSNAVINSATIHLSPKPPINLWPYQILGNDAGEYTYNWSLPNIPFKLNEYQSYLSRITATGSNFDTYSVTNTNRVALPNSLWAICDPATQDVTNLVTDMLASPSQNRGMLFHLASFARPSVSETRFLSFANTVCEDCDPGGGTFLKTLAAPPSCAPYLTINYTVPKDTCVPVCRNNIVDSASNPYRWGFLGNWRMERAYTYYNARQEDDATIKSSNIRTEGTLKDFVPYWSFGAKGITGSSDATRWVWNSTISLFQKRGFEIENYDALGRFNAGLYGYNQTVPVAVAQNARYSEILYDGFEDYGFKTSDCIHCPPKREFDFVTGNTGVTTSTAQSHTGLYSLKVNSGSDGLLTVPVTELPVLPSVAAGIRYDTIQTGQVSGAGTGLTGIYYMGEGADGVSCSPTGVQHLQVDNNVNFYWGTVPPFTDGECSSSYQVQWIGTIQPRYTDLYTFYLTYAGTATMLVDETTVLNSTTPQTGEVTTASIQLQAGHIYRIVISYIKTEFAPYGQAELRWSSFVKQSKEVVPMAFLYPQTPGLPDTTGSSNLGQFICRSADTVKQSGVVKETFAPLNNSKLTVSAWVRLDVDDCNATPASDEAIQVEFNNEPSTTAWLKKTGLRIEGWQRYEATVSVPGDATQMKLHLKSLSSNNIFVDDIRVQPFHSSMKTFVYNPTNMRLMADLDENNYASYYEYDDDGTLIRVKKETERGIMTIQETRSALFKD